MDIRYVRILNVCVDKSKTMILNVIVSVRHNNVCLSIAQLRYRQNARAHHEIMA